MKYMWQWHFKLLQIALKMIKVINSDIDTDQKSPGVGQKNITGHTYFSQTISKLHMVVTMIGKRLLVMLYGDQESISLKYR